MRCPSCDALRQDGHADDCDYAATEPTESESLDYLWDVAGRIAAVLGPGL